MNRGCKASSAGGEEFPQDASGLLPPGICVGPGGASPGPGVPQPVYVPCFQQAVPVTVVVDVTGVGPSVGASGDGLIRGGVHRPIVAKVVGVIVGLGPLGEGLVAVDGGDGVVGGPVEDEDRHQPAVAAHFPVGQIP